VNEIKIGGDGTQLEKLRADNDAQDKAIAHQLKAVRDKTLDIRTLPEEAQRTLAVANMRTWLGAPYHHMGRARGGVDCGGLFLAGFAELGLIEPGYDTGWYPEDFMLHSDEERFLKIVEVFAYKVAREPRDGDFPLFKVGRVIAHSAIVDQWPRVIHAFKRIGKVDYADATAAEMVRYPLQGIWTFKEWH
jgi:cell wall-associated NlpC family hydrolase